MDLRLSEEQELIRSTARDFLEAECPTEKVRALEKDPKGYSPEMWTKMADLGWLGICFPEEHGGTGHGFVELCVLLEELSRVRAPGPYLSTVALCGQAIDRFGTDQQRSTILPAIAGGQRIAVYAEMEPGGTWGPSKIDTRATLEGDRDYVLEGTKIFVPYAHAAEVILVAARTGDDLEKGLTVFLVPGGSPGVSLDRLETIGSDPLYEVRLQGVRVPAESVLGDVNGGWPIVQAINQWGAAGTCAAMVGGAQKVLEMTVQYANERVQFDRPIGTFQAVQHHCADMATDVTGSRFIAYEAIWRVGEGLDASEEVSMAKAWVSDAYQRVCNLGHQVHGAIGFTEEHAMQLFSRHARAAEIAFGDAGHHRERLARALGI